jgi:hypothetical protein
MGKKKQAAPPPVSAANSREMDLLLSVLAKLGVAVDRATHDTLAGFIKGVLDESVLLWAEIFGAGNQIGVQLSSGAPFFDERLAEMRATAERLSSLPECFTGDERWLRVAVSQPGPGGGRKMMLLAVIKPSSGDLTAELCEEKFTTILGLVRKEWPMK